jgi:phosphoribosyl-ATP pyrophosphohydrolase
MESVSEPVGESVVGSVFKVVESRKSNAPVGSYTAELFAGGEDRILKRVGEEAIEVIVAAKGEGDDRVVYEMADLVYHCLVLLAERGLTWQAIETELARRVK